MTDDKWGKPPSASVWPAANSLIQSQNAAKDMAALDVKLKADGFVETTPGEYTKTVGASWPAADAAPAWPAPSAPPAWPADSGTITGRWTADEKAAMIAAPSDQPIEPPKPKIGDETTVYGQVYRWRSGDEHVVANLRFRWKDELHGYGDLDLMAEYDAFSYTDMHGDNDAQFLAFLNGDYVEAEEDDEPRDMMDEPEFGHSDGDEPGLLLSQDEHPNLAPLGHEVVDAGEMHLAGTRLAGFGARDAQGYYVGIEQGVKWAVLAGPYNSPGDAIAAYGTVWERFANDSAWKYALLLDDLTIDDMMVLEIPLAAKRKGAYGIL